MKNITLILLIWAGLFQFSCHQEIYIDEESEIAQRYKNYKVDFFSSHMDFEIKEPEFETVTEQVLLREAHRVGATFETFTEQVLVKAAYSKIKIVDVLNMSIVVNAEINLMDNISCYHFLDPSEFTTIDIPAEYSSRVYYKLLIDGNGDEVPAVYTTRMMKNLKTPGQVNDLTSERNFLQVSFRIPDNISIDEYLADQFSQYNLSNCVEGNSYRIVE